MTLRSPFEWLDDPTSAALVGGPGPSQEDEDALPECFTRDPALFPAVVFAGNPGDQASATEDRPMLGTVTLGDEEDITEEAPAEQQPACATVSVATVTVQHAAASPAGVSSQTVPESPARRVLVPHRRGDDPELNALRDIARSRRGEVMTTSTISRSGRSGLDGRQTFLVAAAGIFSSTLIVAWFVAAFLPQA